MRTAPLLLLTLLLLVAAPVLWLLWLPFKLLGITFQAVFALIRALLFLPAPCAGADGRWSVQRRPGLGLLISSPSRRKPW